MINVGGPWLDGAGWPKPGLAAYVYYGSLGNAGNLLQSMGLPQFSLSLCAAAYRFRRLPISTSPRPSKVKQAGDGTFCTLSVNKVVLAGSKLRVVTYSDQKAISVNLFRLTTFLLLRIVPLPSLLRIINAG